MQLGLANSTVSVIGKRMIPYSRQTVTEADIEAVTRVLRSDALTTGPVVQEFEAALCEQTGARHAVVCSSGTAALHLACLASDLQAGDLAITTPITFVASANCAEYCGARTGFIDIDPTSLCLSVAELQSRLEQTTKRPKLVIPVDFAGVPAALPELFALSRTYGFQVVADSAHSIGSSYVSDGENVYAGACRHSDAAIFSFHPVKTLTTGEGGAVMTNDPLFAERLRLFLSHGTERATRECGFEAGPWSYQIRTLGYRYRITDIQCALGLSQLKRLPEMKARRQEIFQRYTEALAPDERLILPPWPEGTAPCFHLYVVRFREGSKRRAQVYDDLRARGIQTQVHYTPIYWQPYYRAKYGYEAGMCPRAEDYYSSCLSLPLFPALKTEEISYVVESLQAALKCPLR